MDSKGSDHMTKLKRFTCSAVLAAMPLLAQAGFSGKWELNPSKSKNIGMMSQMKLIATIQQTTDDLIIGNATTFNDKQSMSEIRLNFAGKPVTNKNPMEAPAETITTWQGKALITTWTSPGSVAGTKSVRTEKRSLSSDNQVLTVESSRGSSPPIVMVYDRQ
jgi:hypothetical protein